MMTMKTYSELITYQTFKERYEYLKLNSKVGNETFGCNRYLNQCFYKSKEWNSIRNKVIARDYGNDLGIDGYEIHGLIYVHHINPITIDDIRDKTMYLLDPEFLICTSKSTHDAIHYGSFDTMPRRDLFEERKPNDTCPWRI